MTRIPYEENHAEIKSRIEKARFAKRSAEKSKLPMRRSVWRSIWEMLEYMSN
jgi:hypothetical protein